MTTFHRPWNGSGGTSTRAAQRFGYVTSRSHTTTAAGHQDTYLVQDEETGSTYRFGYADIVTEGLRIVRLGERVRFLIDHAHPGHASYVIRLDQPDIRELCT